MCTLIDARRCCGHALSVGNCRIRKHLRLGYVRRDDRRTRQEFGAKCRDSILTDEACAAGRDHDGIDDDVPRMVLVEFFRDHADECGIRDHADLYGIGRDVGEYCIELRREKVGRDGENVRDPRGVLRCECGKCAHAVDAVRGHGFEICLNARAAARITSRNGECRVYFQCSSLLRVL